MTKKNKFFMALGLVVSIFSFNLFAEEEGGCEPEDDGCLPVVGTPIPKPKEISPGGSLGIGDNSQNPGVGGGDNGGGGAQGGKKEPKAKCITRLNRVVQNCKDTYKYLGGTAMGVYCTIFARWLTPAGTTMCGGAAAWTTTKAMRWCDSMGAKAKAEQCKD